MNDKKFHFCCFAILILLSGTVSLVRAQKGTVADLLRRGDSAYAAFDNPTALRYYQIVLQREPESYAALWRTARAYSDVGEAEPDKEKKRRLFRIADSLARRCATLHPDSAESHFVMTMAIGRLALFVGGKKKIAYAKEIKAEAEKTLEIDPRHDGAYHVLGRWHYELATLSWFMKAAAKVIFGGVPPGASLEESAAFLQKAVELAPEKMLHRLEYARTLIKLERYAEARDQLELCLALKPTLWDDQQRRVEAEALLRKIKKK